MSTMTARVSAAGRRSQPSIGYYYAGLNAIISGFAIYINSLGVKLFSDSALYTTLKNAVVGVALVIPLLFFARRRAEWRRLSPRQWGLLALLAIIGGSVPYVLFFRGLQLSTPVTGSLLNHAQFLLVAVLAVLLLGERIGIIMGLALATLLVGTTLGTNLHQIRWNEGTWLLIASTILFAAGVVLAKYLLRGISMLTVMTAKMSLGSLLLIGYVAATGRVGAISHLSAAQWEYVLITGLILLAFTVTAFAALRSASATAVTAIPAASPLITTLLVVLASGRIALKPVDWLGLVLMVLAVVTIYVVGRRHEQQRWQTMEHSEGKAMAV